MGEVKNTKAVVEEQKAFGLAAKAEAESLPPRERFSCLPNKLVAIARCVLYSVFLHCHTAHFVLLS